MNSMPQNLPVSQAEAAREAARRSAVFSGGHKFIWLTLLDTKYRKISGIEVVHASPYLDEQHGVTRYSLEVRGGATSFEFDQGVGAFRYAMLDSQHNRQFLSSHYHLEFWLIEDEGIRKDVEDRSKQIEQELKGNPEKEPEEVVEDQPEQVAEPVQVAKTQPAVKGKPNRKPEKKTAYTMPAAIPLSPPVDDLAKHIQSDLVTPVSRVIAP